MNEPASVPALRFVVQKHAARTLHYDFRLERDGVFRSWAVPKGVPEQAGEKRLAIQVEDHTLEFGDFEGTIADGQYGAGQIEIWDRGRYEIGQWLEDTVQFTLHGQRYRGQFRLIRFPRGGPQAWLLVKSADLPNAGAARNPNHLTTDDTNDTNTKHP